MDIQTAEVDARRSPSRRLRSAIAIVVLQALAALFFVIDSITDVELSPGGILADFSWLEVGIAMGSCSPESAWVPCLRASSSSKRASANRSSRVAQGALAEVISQRFAEWKLSGAETDVAMFSLKGCTIGEIARMRGSAEGTVRAQLSQVYAKAGVTSQPTLVALFIEELLQD